MKHQLRPHQPDTIALRRIEIIQFGGIGHIDHDLHALAIAADRASAPHRGLFATALCLRRPASVKSEACRRIGIDDEYAAVAIEKRLLAGLELADAYADDHRYAAAPGENGDMARRTTALEHQSAPLPIRRKKSRGRHIFRRDNRPDGRRFLYFPGELAQDAVTQVAQIRRSALEMGIAGRIVGRYLRVDPGRPGFVCRQPPLHHRKRRRRQCVIFEKRELEGEDGFCLLVHHALGEPRQLVPSRSERVNERSPFFPRGATVATAAHRLVQSDKHAHGEAGRRGPSLQLKRAIRQLDALFEAIFNEGGKRLHGRFRIGALGAKVDRRVFRRLHRHHLDDALGIHPRAGWRKAEIDLRGKALRELCQLDRGAGVKTDLVSDQGPRAGPCGHRRHHSPRRQFFGGATYGIERRARRGLGRRHDGTLDDRRVAHYDASAPYLRQHLDRHLAVGLGAAEIDENSDTSF